MNKRNVWYSLYYFNSTSGFYVKFCEIVWHDKDKMVEAAVTMLGYNHVYSLDKKNGAPSFTQMMGLGLHQER